MSQISVYKIIFFYFNLKYILKCINIIYSKYIIIARICAMISLFTPQNNIRKWRLVLLPVLSPSCAFRDTTFDLSCNI